MMHQPCKEEFSDWPNGLLSIGTFGNSNLRQSENFSTQHVENTTPEDIEEVDKQLIRLLLNKQISLDSSFPGESEKQNLSVEKFLDRLREDEKKTDESTQNLLENKDRYLQRATSIVHRGGNTDIRSDKKKTGIGKKSLSFLLKKVFVCRGGFAPGPVLRDPIPDPKLDSRMEKILRAMLHKKIYPQRPSPKTTSKKYLDMSETDNSDEEECEEASHSSKWVKTDSEWDGDIFAMACCANRVTAQ
ncbi:hypothetical protein DH2020_034477 [Rehmannia glutinosa]|uniref:Uncharacterized protein n=1 Tax=Rehmannia glutinosa TaxID=99300 RepID=A0ABR0V9Q6_REHGL